MTNNLLICYQEVQCYKIYHVVFLTIKLLFFTLTGGAVYAYKTVPNELDFQGSLNEADNDLMTVSESLVNKNAEEHVQNLYKLQSQDLLRFVVENIFNTMKYDGLNHHCLDLLSMFAVIEL